MRIARFPYTALAFFLCAGLAPALLLSSGCRPSEATGNGPLSVPAEGSVRVLSTKVEQTADRLHWKWTIIGERNWATPSAQNTQLALSQTYPANKGERRDGTNIWEADLWAERKGGTLVWRTRLHGINGETCEAKGETPLGNNNGSESVQIEHDRPTVERLPATVTLARIGDQTVTWQIAK